MSRLLRGTLFLGVLSLLGVAGCSTSPRSDYSAVDLVPATGTITLDGKPLPNAVVTFEAEDGQFSYGLTDRSGQFQLHFDTVMKGVTPGHKVVKVSTTRKILGLNTEEEGGSEESGEEGSGSARSQSEKELVPAKYNAQSQLTVDVSLDVTEYDFELKSS